MSTRSSSLARWTPEQLALGRRWVAAWQTAGPELERLRIEELRRADPYRSIELLCGDADYRSPPRAPKSTSGLIEQQAWFARARRR